MMDKNRRQVPDYRDRRYAETVRTELALAHLMALDARVVDRVARHAVENGRDWRGLETMRARRPVRESASMASTPAPETGCHISYGCGYHFCFKCGGNDWQDAPFTCGEVT